jgi:hypothetical protein
MDSICLNILFFLGLKNSNKQNPQKAYKYITVWPLLHNQSERLKSKMFQQVWNLLYL